MISKTTRAFWRCFDSLPDDVQLRTRRAYANWRVDPSHPGLNFKRVSRSQPVYSVRVSLAHRALGMLEKDTVIWFWIGSHDDYERLLKG